MVEFFYYYNQRLLKAKIQQIMYYERNDASKFKKFSECLEMIIFQIKDSTTNSLIVTEKGHV